MSAPLVDPFLKSDDGRRFHGDHKNYGVLTELKHEHPRVNALAARVGVGSNMNRLQAFFSVEGTLDRIDEAPLGAEAQASSEADVAAGSGVSFTASPVPLGALQDAQIRPTPKAQVMPDAIQPLPAHGDVAIVSPRWAAAPERQEARSRSASPDLAFEALLVAAVESRVSQTTKLERRGQQRRCPDDNSPNRPAVSSASALLTLAPPTRAFTALPGSFGSTPLPSLWDPNSEGPPQRACSSSPPKAARRNSNDARDSDDEACAAGGGGSSRSGAGDGDEGSRDGKVSFHARHSSHLRFVLPRETPRSCRSNGSRGKMSYLDVPEAGADQFQAFAKDLAALLSVECAASNPYIQALAAHREAITESEVDLQTENCNSLAARLGTQRYDALATLDVQETEGDARGRAQGAESSRVSAWAARAVPIFDIWPPFCLRDQCAEERAGVTSFEFTPAREDTVGQDVRGAGGEQEQIIAVSDVSRQSQLPRLEDHLAGRKNAQSRSAAPAGPSPVPPLQLPSQSRTAASANAGAADGWLGSLFERVLGNNSWT